MVGVYVYVIAVDQKRNFIRHRNYRFKIVTCRECYANFFVKIDTLEVALYIIDSTDVPDFLKNGSNDCD